MRIRKVGKFVGCLNCKDSFWNGFRPTAKFCSNKCVGDYQRGEKNPFWRGGIYIAHGRVKVRCPDHPKAICGYVYRYVLVVEKALGRKLKRNEIVHHINGDMTDDRIENLEVMTQSKHMKMHIQERKRRPNGQLI